ncbi:hypothetical protein RCL_jg2289.t1 [Rhizophagus clarus]|uniref:SUN domain-containing protein n=1 Tax=Rhizophagus clarus TaxID=94130 RepID=A0A8H3KSE7_9GLOM|nr:hypothetical protein RCL_jg2289.t1 [Rhizophagus clarus]
MPARRKSSEPQTPPATPIRNRRNGSGSSQSSQFSTGSQKYTAYLRERPTSTNGIYSPPTQEKNPFSREEEIYVRLQLESSQPSIFHPKNDDIVDDVIDDDDTNQFVPNFSTDRSIIIDDDNNNNNSKDIFSSNRIYAWAIDNKTYKIQPIGEKKNDVNDSRVITADDFKKMIQAEVKNYIDGELSPRSNEPLRAMIIDEIKNIISSEFKKIPIRKRFSSRDEETSIRKRGSLRDEKALELIRNEARIVVKDELLKYSQDKLNRRDFALHSGGAKIITKYTSKTYEQWPSQWYKKITARLTGSGITRGKPPVTAISHDTNVGQCWPLSGQEGQLAIFLDRRIYVTAVTYDHISKDIATDDVLSAPKDFEVWGIIDDATVGKDNNDNDEDLSMDLNEDFNPRMESTEETCSRRRDDQYDDGLSHLNPNLEIETNGELRLGNSPLHLFLGGFTYNISNGSPPIQTFEIPEHILKYNRPIRAIIMKVLNNWGKPEYTCLYRFRVHGEPAIPTVSADPKIK